MPARNSGVQHCSIPIRQFLSRLKCSNGLIIELPRRNERRRYNDLKIATEFFGSDIPRTTRSGLRQFQIPPISRNFALLRCNRRTGQDLRASSRSPYRPGDTHPYLPLCCTPKVLSIGQLNGGFADFPKFHRSKHIEELLELLESLDLPRWLLIARLRHCGPLKHVRNVRSFRGSAFS